MPLPAYVFSMHQHLRAWRLFRGLSQEQVANMLGKRHTTIGRWERGRMKLSTADLEALSKIYNASVAQLNAPPATADLVKVLDRVQGIVSGMPADVLERWLTLGEDLKRS